MFPIEDPVKPECRVWLPISVYSLCNYISHSRCYLIRGIFSTLRKLLLIPTGLDQFTPYVQKECESAHTCTTDHTSIHHRISPDGACLVAKTSISKRNVAEGCAVVRLVVRGGAWVVFSLVGQ